MLPAATRPAGSGTKPITASAVMLLPQPDSPTSARVWPRSIERSMPSTASTVPPSVANSTLSPSTASSGSATAVPSAKLSTYGVALHAARIGPGLQDAAVRCLLARESRKPPARPGLAHLHAVAAPHQFLRGCPREPAFEIEVARVGGARIERARRVLGVALGAIDRFLQIHPVMDM